MPDIVAIMTTPRGNEVQVTRVIGPATSGRSETLYFGWLHGEPIEVPASEAQIRLEEQS